MQAVNVGGTQHVIEAAEAAGVRRVVYFSSVEIFGVPSLVPCPEDGPLSPLGEYAQNKIAAEELCRAAMGRGLEVVVLRSPTIVGPGLDEPFLVGLLGDIRAGRPVTLLGKGLNRFQFVHAEDVAAACLLAAETPAAAGEAFHLGAADVPPIREMVEQVIARVGSASSVRSIPPALARLAVTLLHPLGKAPLEPEHLAIAVADYVFDISKAQRVLGWTPRWGNVEAVLDTYSPVGTATARGG
jgi:nucleoside-diphosphate-sugar epimerase